MRVQIIIPVYHPDEKFNELLIMLKQQTVKDWQLLIIDSGSNKAYMSLLTDIHGAVIHDILPQEFDHGATRQWGIDHNPSADIYIFLTQDAILADENALENLLRAFNEAKVGCTYGRQLPHKNANRFASIARIFNYGENGYLRSIEDKDVFGMKTAFISNSFAAYRRTAMSEVGGFPINTILGEDMFVAAKMLLCGWMIAYQADAKVYHSHNYTVWQEFKRYFDIGVFHSKECWIRETFGKAEKTGAGFVRYELKELRNTPWLISVMIIRDGMKFLGYRLGIMEHKLPLFIKKKICMNSKYWG